MLTGRERILAMIAGEAIDHLPLMPITMMYAADQIGVKYRDYVSDHRVLVEAQMQTAARFRFDHVSCISDPGREAADCGARVEFFDDQPPALSEEHPLLADKEKIRQLKIPDPWGGGRMHDRVNAVALFKKRLGTEKLVEGWVEGPCAEGADLRGINRLMLDFYDDPDFTRELFEFVVAMELRFAEAQVEAGADLIGVGDAAASLVSPRLYEAYIWPYQKRLVDGIKSLGVPVRLHICGKTRHLMPGMGRLECDIVDLDYLASLEEARKQMNPGQVLLGNIEPVGVVRDGDPETIRRALEECHRQAGERYIVGAGCEIPRGTPVESLLAMAEYAESHRWPPSDRQEAVARA